MTMSGQPQQTPALVTARPIVLSRIAWSCAVLVLIVFTVVAFVMTRDNAGATFVPKDQVGTVVLGVIIAAGFWLLSRPRLIADQTSVRMRSFAGNYRTVPWAVVARVEFPSNSRFARLVLPGEEILALYAVQRLDKDRSVEVMRELRALFAATHPDAE
jgi:hypothetical protein